MENKPIRIGIVGLGEHMVRAHVKHLLEIEDVIIARYFDPGEKVDTSSFNDVAKKPIDSTFEEILNDESINVVFIGSPDKYHAVQMLRCIESGKHVFCEKPMVVTFDDKNVLQKALDLASVNNVVISSCHPRRFDHPFVWLKKQLSDERWVKEKFGTITDFNFDFWYHEVTDEWKKDRSLLKDHFGHEIDLYRFLFNNKNNWYAAMIYDDYDKYKVVGKSESVEFPNFEFTGNRSLSEKVYQETVTIKGTKDAFVMQINSGVGFWMKNALTQEYPKLDYEDKFKIVNEDFINAVRGISKPYLTHEDMLINNISGVELVRTGNYFPMVQVKMRR